MLQILQNKLSKKQQEVFWFALGGIALLIGIGVFLLSARSSHQEKKQAAAPKASISQDINQDFRFLDKGYSGEQTIQDEAVRISSLEAQIQKLESIVLKKERENTAFGKGNDAPTNAAIATNPSNIYNAANAGNGSAGAPHIPATSNAPNLPNLPPPGTSASAAAGSSGSTAITDISSKELSNNRFNHANGANTQVSQAQHTSAPALGVLKPLYKEEGANTGASGNKPKFILPMGSIFKAIPLGGFIALTDQGSFGSSGSGVGGGATSISNARYGSPFSARIKGATYLPNNHRTNILNDCHVIAGGVANVSASRVDVNAYAIRCTDASGQIYGAEVADPQLGSTSQVSPSNVSQQPFAVGWDEDGIRGLQATVVVRSSTALQKEFLAGFIGNLGLALAPQQVPTYNSNFSGGQAQYQTPNLTGLAGSSLGSGLSKSANLLAEQYAKFADAVKPAMEVRSGLIITFQTMRDIALVPLVGKN